MIDADGLAARYFAAMRASDLAGLLVLFAPDATLSVPDGRTFHGIAAIGGWFTTLFGAVSPSPTCIAENRGAWRNRRRDRDQAGRRSRTPHGELLRSG